MKGKKNALVKALLAVTLTACSVGFAACGKDDKKPVSYGETGIYCFYAVDEEYNLTLNNGKYSLTIDGTELTGKYAYDGVILNLYAESGDMIGSINGTLLTLSYNGTTYTFYKKVDFTVDFNVDGGSAIPAATVVNGTTATKPADPVKEGYYFVGWYADAAFTTPFAFDSTIITANTTVYARFVAYSAQANEYTAMLEVDGELLEIKTTVGGVLYNLPTPEKADATFAGWWISDYNSADKLTCKYNEQKLERDVVLFAVWDDSLQVSVNNNQISWAAIKTGVEYTVTISSNGSAVAAPYKTTALSYDFDFAALQAGEYTVTVEGNGKSATAYYVNKALAEVAFFNVNGSTLEFNAVANATNYVITVV